MTNDIAPDSVREVIFDRLEEHGFDVEKVTRLYSLTLGVPSVFIGATVDTWLNSISKRETYRVHDLLLNLECGGGR